jgi:hypothetical protein
MTPPPSISGLTPDTLALPTEQFFARFPWKPDLQAVLLRWPTEQVFQRFVPRHDR